MNGRSFTFAIFVLIIGLAIFGLVSSVITNPMGVLRNIGYMLLVVGIFYLLYKMFTNSSGSANSQSSYKRCQTIEPQTRETKCSTPKQFFL